MVDDTNHYMAAEPPEAGFASKRFLDQLLTLLIVLAARWFAPADLDGALLIELPTGRRVQLGRGFAARAPVVTLRRYRVLHRAWRGGSIGFAEAYIAGEVVVSDLTALFRFYLQNRRRLKAAGGSLFAVKAAHQLAHRTRRNTRHGSRRNIVEHYDLGDAFFARWLDADMVYSSALFDDANDTLETAQARKLSRILALLELAGSERILEIGCGWGALAREAATHHGCTVRGITLSDTQLAAAVRRAEEAGLDSHCQFRLEDYRDTQGQFDRIMSVEMIEAVGEEYWPDFFRMLHDRLKPGGTAVLQAITIDDTVFEDYRRSPDFIQRYIFPGGMLPTSAIIRDEAARAGLRLDLVECFGDSYARTLDEWCRRFENAWPEIAALGFDEQFRRRWRYYLAYCEAGFRDGIIDVGFYRFRRGGEV